MAKSIDGESIFLSDEISSPTAKNRLENEGVSPTILVGESLSIGGGSLGHPLASAGMSNAETGNETVLGEVTHQRCVGWLLVVSGPMEGNSFPLTEGRNSVGRDPSNKVAIPTDPGISRSSQVYVVYDPEENGYVVVPGDGSAIARLNGKRLDIPAPLKHGDFISLSRKTVVRFVPACDSAFRWKNEV